MEHWQGLRTAFDRAAFFTMQDLAAELGQQPTDDQFYAAWAEKLAALGRTLREWNLADRVAEGFNPELPAGQWAKGVLLTACRQPDGVDRLIELLRQTAGELTLSAPFRDWIWEAGKQPLKDTCPAATASADSGCTEAVEELHPEAEWLQGWANIGVLKGKFCPGWWEHRANCQWWRIPVDGEPNHWLPVIEGCMRQLFTRPLVEDELLDYLFREHGMPPGQAAELNLQDLADLLREDCGHRQTKPATVPDAAGAPRPADQSSPVSVGIVIALREEFAELFREIKSSCSVEMDQETGNHLYLFERSGAVAPYKCVATWAGEMGPEKAILATEHVRRVWSPKTVVNIGIAAGVDKDVRVGDVLVATQVDNYLHRSKAVPAEGGQGFELEWGGAAYPCSQDLVAAVRNFRFAHLEDYRRWRRRCSARLRSFIQEEQRSQLALRDLVRKQADYTEGHLASGPIVGASAAFLDWLKRRDRAFMGLEMEAVGVMTALYAQADLKRSLILRGISDYGDERKKDLDEVKAGALRRYAMCNALHLLWVLLKADALPH
jgi:nucleoside phosphorylase